ncbi:MAG TPA: 4Fe-4S binding protein [Usitatibacteraceae bacterium]
MLTTLEVNGFSRPPATSASASPAGNPIFEAKLAALVAANEMAPFEPVASVAYHSAGRLLIMGGDARVASAVKALAGKLSIAVLWTGTGTGARPAPAFVDIEVIAGQCNSLRGYLGAFELQWQSPGRAPQLAAFDLVLDLETAPAFSMHQPPQGYFHAAEGDALDTALAELPEMIGEFEKPKFFAYKESICAHSRSKKTGCNNCIDICSTRAISADGDKVKVDPHLCMGCGACATVCPSGAMSYQYPRVADRGAQLRAMLNAYRAAAAGAGAVAIAAPLILFHNATDGREALRKLAREGRGLPPQVLPIETWHVAAIGLDLLLGAFAYGAAGVAVLAAGSEAPEYAAALKHEMSIGDTVLNALGFAGRHFSWIDGRDTALAEQTFWTLPVLATVTKPAVFHLSNDKRGTLEFVIDHLLLEAKAPPTEIALPAGSLYGRVDVDVAKCTLCLACAGACPESALMDGADYPRLKFLERNCVQCGLCEQTCPEKAITLVPRLLLTDARKKEVVLNESEPFNCISCGAVLGTRQMIDSMLGKLAGHSMFAGPEKLKRLQMCADCRVVDMMSNKHEYSILTGKAIE